MDTFFEQFSIRCDNYIILPDETVQCTHMDNPGAKCCPDDCPRWVGEGRKMPEKTEIFSRGQRSGKTAELVQEIRAEALREASEKIESMWRKETSEENLIVYWVTGLQTAQKIVEDMIKDD